MSDTEEKINTEPREAEIQEEEIEKKETPELKEDEEVEEKTEKIENMETPKPKRKPATKKKPVIVEIPVDQAETSQPASSSTEPVPKARGRPKGSLGAKKREPPPEPAEPAQQVSPPELTLADVLRHTRMMQEARRNQTREKYKSWVV